MYGGVGLDTKTEYFTTLHSGLLIPGGIWSHSYRMLVIGGGGNWHSKDNFSEIWAGVDKLIRLLCQI